MAMSENNQKLILQAADILARVEARYDGEHDVDPGTAPLHYTTYQVINAIAKLIAVIETQQVQINMLLQAVPQAGKREG